MCVLLVEDEALLLLTLASDLKDAGFDVLPCENADVALVRLDGYLVRPAGVPAISILVTDVRMPGTIDGVGLARHVREHYPEMPIVILSAEATSVYVRDSGDVRLSKPVDMGVLVKTISTLTVVH